MKRLFRPAAAMTLEPREERRRAGGVGGQRAGKRRRHPPARIGGGGVEDASADAQKKNLRARRFSAESQPPRRGEIKSGRLAPYFRQNRADPGAARALQRRLQRLHVAPRTGDDEMGRVEPVFMQANPIRPPRLQGTKFRANP